MHYVYYKAILVVYISVAAFPAETFKLGDHTPLAIYRDSNPVTVLTTAGIEPATLIYTTFATTLRAL